MADLHKAINKEYTVSDDGKCPNCVDAIMCDDVKKLFEKSLYVPTDSASLLCGADCGELVFAPYEKKIKNLSKGEHIIEFKLFGTQVNIFSALYNCNRAKNGKVRCIGIVKMTAGVINTASTKHGYFHRRLLI